jgi:hypothetical protein
MDKPPFEMIHLATVPKPIIGIHADYRSRYTELSKFLDNLLISLCHDSWRFLARCVVFERLSTVLRTGTDVEPSDSPMYLSTFHKAMEYGNGFEDDTCKLLLLYDRHFMQRTGRQVFSDTPPEKIEEYRKTYPTELRDEAGNLCWLSRLQASDRHIGTSYEAEYAFWIPGDPFEALVAIFVLGTAGKDITERTQPLISACEDIQWH